MENADPSHDPVNLPMTARFDPSQYSIYISHVGVHVNQDEAAIALDSDTDRAIHFPSEVLFRSGSR